MDHQLVRDGFTGRPQVGHCIRHVRGIPIDDCRDDQAQPGGPILLRFMAAIDDAALPECADCLGERVPLISQQRNGIVQRF